MSISTQAELLQAIEQTARLEEGLLSLHRDLPNATARNFAVLVEGPVDQLAELQADIQEYLARSRGDDFVEMRLVGPNIHLRETPTSVLTNMLDTLRKGIQAIAELKLTGQRSTRPTAELKKLCDLRVLALAPGSLRVLMRLPDEDQGLMFQGERNAAALALDDYLMAAGWAGSDEDVGLLDQKVADPRLRKVILAEIERVVPRPRGALEFVEFSGPRVEATSGRQRLRLSRSSRGRINQAIDRFIHTVQETHEGLLREIDLDKKSFILRRPEEPRETPCRFGDELLDAAKDALDKTVKVIGLKEADPTRRVPADLFVTRMEILDDDGESIEVGGNQ